MAEELRRRLFFALWPPHAVAEHVSHSLRTTLGRHGGKWQRLDQLHITLAFLGSVDDEFAECVQRAARAVHAPPFELELNRLGFFRRAGVVWLAPATVPPALNALYTELSQALETSCALQPERRPFHPHLTLLRKSRRPPPVEAIGPIYWPVSEFVLMESRTLPEGARYQLVNKWPLTVD